MGLFTRKKETSEAERSLARLQEGTGKGREPEIYVTVMDPPTATTPGTPLSCYNESDPVRVGQEVQIFGSTFVEQRGRIMGMTRDGAPIDTLEYGEEAEVVLDDGVDLSEVFRGGELVSPSDTRVEPTGSPCRSSGPSRVAPTRWWSVGWPGVGSPSATWPSRRTDATSRPSDAGCWRSSRWVPSSAPRS